MGAYSRGNDAPEDSATTLGVFRYVDVWCFGVVVLFFRDGHPLVVCVGRGLCGVRDKLACCECCETIFSFFLPGAVDWAGD